MADKRTTSGCAVVETTLDGADRAEELARRIVTARLAACVQTTPIRSVYHWQGRIETAAEFRLTAKTQQARVAALLAFIKANHPYEVPEILVLPVTAGHAPYLAWIERETADAAAGEPA